MVLESKRNGKMNSFFVSLHHCYAMELLPLYRILDPSQRGDIDIAKKLLEFRGARYFGRKEGISNRWEGVLLLVGLED